MFGEITPRYDLLNRLMSLRRDVYWRRKTVELMPRMAKRVVDIASGTGDLAIEIANRRKAIKVYSVDFVPSMLELAKKKMQTAVGAKNIELMVGDAMNLPFADNSFDASAIAFGLRNIPDKIGALQEMARVVQPGGKVLVLEMTFPRNLGLRWFFKCYLNLVIPVLGGLISGNFKAYRYLPESIQDFLNPGELSELFRQAGMIEVSPHRLTFGITYLHEGTVA